MYTRFIAALGSVPIGLSLMLTVATPASAMPHAALSSEPTAAEPGVAPEKAYYYYRRYYRYYYRPRYYGYRYYYRPRYRYFY